MTPRTIVEEGIRIPQPVAQEHESRPVRLRRSSPRHLSMTIVELLGKGSRRDMDF